MKTKIVLGLGYGDEGKGITTDYLVKQAQNPLVIRFSGGHQAGHTVVTEDGFRHVFSSFGSGTLRGIPSYCSRFCTLYPIGFMNEYKALEAAGYTPTIFVDALAMVTTPYDLFFNRKTEKKNKHGSCGLGFGSTVARNETPYKLYAQDLYYPRVMEQKLKAIAFYYQQKHNAVSSPELEEAMDFFHYAVEELVASTTIKIVQEKRFFRQILEENKYDELIFEGSQGILLDMDHGFFPNVTRANTTSKNAMRIIEENELALPSIYYITRAYQTRHGNGFLSYEGKPNIVLNPKETNQYNEWQGYQRLGLLDVDLLNYALECDLNYSKNATRHLVVTCMDQLIGDIEGKKNGGDVAYKNANELVKDLSIEASSVIESWSDCSNRMEIVSV